MMSENATVASPCTRVTRIIASTLSLYQILFLNWFLVQILQRQADCKHVLLQVQVLVNRLRKGELFRCRLVDLENKRQKFSKEFNI